MLQRVWHQTMKKSLRIELKSGRSNPDEPAFGHDEAAIVCL